MNPIERSSSDFMIRAPQSVEKVESKHEICRWNRPLLEDPCTGGSSHPGATSGYRERGFGERNIQIIFHENDRPTIDGIDCVKVEPDIDYIQDLSAHTLTAIPVNAYGALTDPKAVYMLRWMAGRHAGILEFDPLDTIE